MNFNVNLIFQVVNALITMLCGTIILGFVYKEKFKRHVFYYGWSIGFILYGTQILLRAFWPDNPLVSIPQLLAFIIFLVSTGFLSGHTKVVLALLPIVFALFSAAIPYYLGIMHNDILNWGTPSSSIIASFCLYIPMITITIIHRKLFGNCVDKVIIGWFLLFLINVLLPMGGWVLDTLAIFSKILILNGIVSYDFALVTQKIQNELSRRTLPATTGYGQEGGLALVTFNHNSKPPLTVISEWIKDRVDKNIRQNMETNVIVLQNIIPTVTLRSIAWSKPELVHVFIFSENPANQEEFTTLRYGLTELGATITEVVKRLGNKKKGEIILVDLSILVNTFGAINTYKFLLNKMGILRSSRTLLTAIFYPEIHEEKVVNLFKTIVDDIISI
jgi:hypothetical protein